MTEWLPVGMKPSHPPQFTGMVVARSAFEFRSLELGSAVKPKQKPDLVESPALPMTPVQSVGQALAEQKLAEFAVREAELKARVQQLQDDIARTTMEHEASLRALEQDFASRLTESIQVEIRTSFEQLKDDLADSVAQVLRPLLSHAATEIALRQFTDLVEGLFREGKLAEMKVEVPAPYLQRLKHALPEGTCLVPSQSAGFEISIGQEVVSLRLDEWLETIRAGESHV